METDSGRSLATARLIAIVVYVVGLVVYPLVGLLARVKAGVSSETLAVLGPAMLGVGVADYVASSVMERALLSAARRAPAGRRPARVMTAAVMTAAFGESLAVLGLVVSLVGARDWGGLLYLLCLVHGVHLRMRWSQYESAAAGETEM